MMVQVMFIRKMTHSILTRVPYLGLLFVSALALSLIWTATVSADGPGSLDTSFNGTGIITTSVSSKADFGYSVALQPDGKLVMAGLSDVGPAPEADLAVVRYNSNGSLDSSFNNTGVVTTSLGSGSGCGPQNAVAIQPDGKLVMAGSINNDNSCANSDFAVLRYQSNGSPDPGFNGTGIVTTSISSRADVVFAVALQSDGKIVAAGHSDSSSGVNPPNFDFAMVRYNNNGSLDTTFNSTGVVTTPILDGSDFGVALAIGSDGKIVMAGASIGPSSTVCVVVRYNTNGSLDSSFNTIGIVTTPCNSGGAYQAVAIQPDGKIVVSGSGFVMRYNTNGSLDSSFNGTGIVSNSVGGNGVAVQSNGKIVVAGFTYGPDSDFAVARYLNNGHPDTGFNHTGIVTTSVGTGTGPLGDIGNAVTIQPDGKIVVAGHSADNGKVNFTVIRYIGDSPFTFLPILLK